MKKSLLSLLLMVFTLILNAQKDTTSVVSYNSARPGLTEAAPAVVSIYPVPVRENFFNIRCDKEITNIRITNIIGQDVYRAQFNTPVNITKVFLENQKRGMYLVTILLTDGSRIVKKIMVEPSE
jgi:hypothetical protein